MTRNLSRTQAIATLEDEPDALRPATCPMCHTRAAVTLGAITAGGDWRCARCGQHWDAERLTAVATYAAWVFEHDRAGSRGGERGQKAQYPDPPTERLDGTS